MTMVVIFSGGLYASLCPPFMIFKIHNRNYHIAKHTDHVSRVSYKTGTKGWMYQTLMDQWQMEHRAIHTVSQNHEQVLFLDDDGGHTFTVALHLALKNIITEIRCFPIIQPILFNKPTPF